MNFGNKEKGKKVYTSVYFYINIYFYLYKLFLKKIDILFQS